MKNVIFALLILLGLIGFCFYNVCFADIYIIKDKNTNEIITMSEKDDTILQNNQEKIILSGDYESYELDDNPTNYLYKNGKFIKNIKRINDLENKKQDEQGALNEEKLVQKEMRKQAIKLLKDKGQNFKYIKED